MDRVELWTRHIEAAPYLAVGDTAPGLHIEQSHGVVAGVGGGHVGHTHVGDGAVRGVTQLWKHVHV